ncbi:MAG: M28 family peptidase [Saprospiraceae bacterium]
MNLIFRALSIICIIGFSGKETAAQYISGVTIPDSSVTLNADSSDLSVKYANTITARDLFNHLNILASDEFEGRETGTQGMELAADYIAMQFKSMGLPAVGSENRYFQDVFFNRTSWNENTLEINGNTYRHLWDYVGYATLNDDMPDFESDEVLYLGYGIDDPNYSDYKGKNVSGRVIMINKGEPYSADSISYVSGTRTPSDWSRSIWPKLETAKANGVRMVLIIEDNLKGFLSNNRRFLVSPSLRLGRGDEEKDRFASHLYISTKMARDIIGEQDKKLKKWRKINTKKGKSKALGLQAKLNGSFKRNVELIEGYNVLGYIEGTDKKDELVVVSAHYDHLGKRAKDIYNGADDNGSGTSSVLEIAEALSLAKKDGKGPRRSVLCLLVTGEEKGLLGSEYYSENPIYPLEKTMVNVNVDMIGRTDKKYNTNTNYIYVIGSDRLSTDLHYLNEQVNQDYSGLTLDYKYNSEKDPNRYYFRSDHYNFAKKGIPAIFFFSGVHEDYHRITDTVDKIMFDKTEKVSRHIFHLIWELANKDEAIRLRDDLEK